MNKIKKTNYILIITLNLLLGSTLINSADFNYAPKEELLRISIGNAIENQGDVINVWFGELKAIEGEGGQKRPLIRGSEMGDRNKLATFMAKPNMSIQELKNTIVPPPNDNIILLAADPQQHELEPLSLETSLGGLDNLIITKDEARNLYVYLTTKADYLALAGQANLDLNGF